MIRAIKEYLERSISGGPNKHACMLMAPKGVAAFNIGGPTIHHALQLQVEHCRWSIAGGEHCRWSTAGLHVIFHWVI